MREETADLVYPIVAYAVQALQSVQRGDQLDMGTVQSELRGRLKTLPEAQRLPDYGGDGDRFLGIRYGLACWLDEIFIRDSPWNAEWNERKLEESLYGTNERAWKFWFQAKLAQMRPGTDALEAYHLLVMLGFRGEGPEKPNTIESWRDAAEAQLARAQNQPWAGPQELQPDLVVTPRRGRERLRTVIVLLIGAVALAVPSASFLLMVRLIGRGGS
jgi:type VI protein secretion system component VasF